MSDEADPRAPHPGDATPAHPGDATPAQPEAVERWETAGGTWRVASVGEGSAVVELLRCDGGECVELLRLTEPAEVRWARVQ
ncbi:hypothetical protein [Leucobacter ruminantium]|uniref:Uncharacterized protein n=1 Tax=Leucobacter ruminantium TaxID=1289170 RepID=A0A939LTT4_9MICO|nr:hypothetical protein [Leucobacter ruminantium]MBO1803986.1 hypothetical protein [Leucobacter ruminantium]